MSEKQNTEKSKALASTASGCYVAPQRKFRMLDLFSGIGGFALAAQWVWGERLEIVSFCEIDKFCQKVLNKHWPKVPIHDDIKTLEGNGWRGTIDLVVGGFPCQPFSVAGKQKSQKDDRYLWHEMLRIITETKPTWVVGENVAGIINLELDKVLADLESANYETITFNIPACAVDAPHRRERVWIVAHYASSGGRDERKVKEFFGEKQGTFAARVYGDVSDTINSGRRQLFQQKQIGRSNELANTGSNGKVQSLAESESSECKQSRDTWARGNGFANKSRWPIEPGVGRVVNGLSNRVDRIKGLGNAVVPQVVAQILDGVALLDDAMHGAT